MLNELVNIVTIGYHVIIKVTKENILNTNTSKTDVKDIKHGYCFLFHNIENRRKYEGKVMIHCK